VAAGKPIATVALGIAAVLCAGAALYWWLGVERTEVYTDDGSIQTSADVVAPRDVLWRPPEPIGALNSAFAEGTPRVSPAGDALYLTRTTADGGSDIYLSRRTGRLWGEPEPVASLNSTDNEHGAAASPDGAWLYFASDRPGGAGGYDVWRAPREGDSWGDPEPLGPEVNTPSDELHPAPDTDGGLLFASDRGGPGEDAEPRGYDLYRARPGSGEPPVVIDALSSPADDVGVALSPSGDFVYLSSDRAGGAGGFDLYRARRLGGGFGPVESLGVPINTAANELEPALAMEGFALLYASDAEGTSGATDLLRSVSREVYLARGSRFAGLWGELLALLPWILALLALILLLAMLRRVHAGGAWEGRLSTLGLMARCVLASLILHALLLALLAYWQVQLAPGSPLGEEDGTRVALVSGGGAESIGSQVRGGFTEAEVARAESERVSPDLSSEMTRSIESTSVPAAADASLAERALPVRADRSDAAIAERGSSTAVTPSTPIESARADAPLGTPDAAARAVAGETERVVARQRSGSEAFEGPAGALGGADDPGSAEIASASGADVSVRSMGVRAGGREMSPDQGGASGVPVPSAVLDAGGTLDPAVGLPTGDGRALSAEAAVANASRVTSGDTGLGPSIDARADTTAGELDPSAIGGSTAAGESVTFGGAASDASAGERTAAPSDAIPGLEVGAVGALTEVELPDATGAGIGAPLAAESDARAARAAVGSNQGTPSVPAGALSQSTRATVEPATVDRDGSDAMRIQAAAAGAEPLDMVSPGVDAPPVESWDALGSLALTPLAAPDGAAGSQVADERGRSIDRAIAGSSESAPSPAVDAARSSSEVAPEVTFTHAEADDVSIATGSSDAAVRGGEPDAVAFDELLPALGVDDLGTIAVPTDAIERAVEAASSSEERGLEVARAPTAEAPLPVASGSSPAAAGAELDPGMVRSGSPELVIGPEARAADPTERPPAPLGIPEAPGMEPMASVAIALPVPAAPLRLTGVVLDDETGEPIAGARVRLDLIDSDGIELTTNGVGAFEMGLDDVPDNIALAAFADGYVPGALNIAEDDLEDDGAYAEFRLVPYNPFEIAMEDEPRVRHLGNDEYSGRINSQFQRETEGREIRFEFELGPDQLPPNVRRAEIVMLAKGVQLPNPVGVNGRRLATTLQESPEDGSFGEQRIPVPLSHLEQGTNWIAFRSIRTPGTDVDDFEFVNVRVVFEPREGAAPF